jgi:cytochrome b561
MSFARNEVRWGGVSQSLHWLVVVLVIAMAALGLSMVELPNTASKARLYGIHKSIGLTILALMLLRLAWRLHAGAPPAIAAMPRWQARVAALTHGALYVLLIAMPLSGWLINSSSGFPLRWFGLFTVPQWGGRDDALNALAKGWHEALFWVLLVLALGHAFAAIWHHLFQRDATLARMLPRGWLEEDP